MKEKSFLSQKIEVRWERVWLSILIGIQIAEFRHPLGSQAKGTQAEHEQDETQVCNSWTQ